MVQLIDTVSPGWCGAMSARSCGLVVTAEPSSAVIVEPAVMPARSAAEPATTPLTTMPVPVGEPATWIPRKALAPMCTVLDALPSRMSCAMASAWLIGMA